MLVRKKAKNQGLWLREGEQDQSMAQAGQYHKVLKAILD